MFSEAYECLTCQLFLSVPITLLIRTITLLIRTITLLIRTITLLIRELLRF